ncbi:MAG: lysylphosphatidylglycerol synthase transmembrane domain-containing protein [Polyangiales bacterium]
MTEAKPKEKKSTLRVLLPRVLFTLATLGLWWWIADLDVESLLESTASLPLSALGLGLVVSLLNLVVGSVRWRVLLSAYGAERLPPFRTLVHLYYVGIFFNTFAPANVGGDVLRGHVTKNAFDGKAGAYLIVLIERVFGLAGLMLLASALMTIAPIPDLDIPGWLGPLGVTAALGAALAPTIGRRIAPWLPGALGRLAGDLPALVNPGLMFVVLLLSIMTQALVAVTGYVCISALAPEVTLVDSLVMVPVAMVSMYLPTIAGLGAREASFVFLFGLLAVGEADATAASLGVFGIQIATALVGGLVLLTAGLPKVQGAEDESENREDDATSSDKGE